MSAPAKQVATRKIISEEEWEAVFPKDVTDHYMSSATFIKQLTVVAVSTVAYFKSAFPKESYSDKLFAEFRLKILKDKSEDALAQYLSSSLKLALEAVDKNFVEQLRFCFYNGDCVAENLIEYYIFEYSYSKNRDSNKKDMRCSLESVQSMTMMFIRSITLFVFEQTREELPINFNVGFWIYYTEDCPENYQAPGFKSITDPCHPDATVSEEVFLGSVETAYHKLIARCYIRDRLVDSDAAAASACSSQPEITQSEHEDFQDCPENYQAPGFKSITDPCQPDATVSEEVFLGSVETAYHKLIDRCYIRDRLVDSDAAAASACSSQPEITQAEHEDFQDCPENYQAPGFKSITDPCHPDATVSEEVFLGSVETPYHKLIDRCYIRDRLVDSDAAAASACSSQPEITQAEHEDFQDCPENYQAPGFKSITDPCHPDATVSEEVFLGSVETPYHKLIDRCYIRDRLVDSDAAAASACSSQPEITQAEHEDFQAEMPLETDSDLSMQPVVRCPCRQQDGQAHDLLLCQYCYTLQHAVCFGLLAPPPADVAHCCADCAASDPARTPTCSSLVGLGAASQRGLCVFRRTLVLCSKSAAVSGAQLKAHCGISSTDTAKLLRLLAKFFIMPEYDYDDLEMRREITPIQLKLTFKKFFQMDDEEDETADRVIIKMEEGQEATDPVDPVSSPVVQLGELISGSPNKTMANNDVLEELPLDGSFDL